METGQPDVVVEVEDLCAGYDERQVLENVSLQVRAGEIMAIMGGSGSGKSTLLRYMLGLHEVGAGRVRILGKDISRLRGKEWQTIRRQIGVAFQGGALLGSMTVGENVCLPLREHTRLDRKTMQIISRMKLEIVNLADCEDYKPSQLSGGMVKRAALARALAMDPRIVFFDEPSAGLDPVVSAELDRLVLQIREVTGVTMVVVTHDVQSALAIADRIAVLDAGRLLMVGSVEEVRSTKNRRVQGLLNRVPDSPRLDAESYLQRLTAGGR